jgi:ferredoxin
VYPGGPRRFFHCLLRGCPDAEDYMKLPVRLAGPGMNLKILPTVVFFLSIIYSAVVLLSLVSSSLDAFPIFWLLGMIIVKPLYRSGAYWVEASILLLLYWLARGDAGYRDVYLYLPLVSTVLMLTAYSTGSRVIRLSVLLLVTGWCAAFFVLASKGTNQPVLLHGAQNYKTGFILACTGFGLILYSLDATRKYPRIGPKTDLVLCSNSGNTAHYAREFQQGMQEAGMVVSVHRFHYYQDFHPELTGDNLVVSFPVSGWKPPWPLISYLIRGLPRGKGKPCFVLYTCAGGPENAGIVTWIILTLKGYYVAGRCWAMYPMNVVTLRLGTKGMWESIDKFMPFKAGLTEARQCGKEFAEKQSTGVPFIFWPFPLFVAGFILDNAWINSMLYRNKSWKRRCKKCGLCISACPSQRLYTDAEGYPYAHGTCALCLLCINICPTNAMQLLFWSEYGQPYYPRWPELVITKRDDLPVER